MQHSPFTAIGQVQQEVREIREKLHNKVERYELSDKASKHEISPINSRLDNLEHTMREIGYQIDAILSRLERVETNQIEPQEEK